MGLKRGPRSFSRQRETPWTGAAEATARVLDWETPRTFSEVSKALSRLPEAGRSPSWADVTATRGLAELEEAGAVIRTELGYVLASESDWLIATLVGNLESARADLATLEGRSRFHPDSDFIEGARERWMGVPERLSRFVKHYEFALDNPKSSRPPQGPRRRFPREDAPRVALSDRELVDTD